MIHLSGISKWYPTAIGRHMVFNDVTLTIPTGVSVGILGLNGAGKSTLLRIIGGIDIPNSGTVTRTGRMSWPLGLGGGFQGNLTGRQNAAFICRVHGAWDGLQRRLDYIRWFSELGQYFDLPINTYSKGMRSRLAFAVSMAFDFDIYLIDELMAVGDPAFRGRCQEAFTQRRGTASVVMVSHRLKDLQRNCQAGILIDRARLHYFDRIDDAIQAYADTVTTRKQELAHV